MDEVTDAHAISLEHLLVLLLENIPNIHPSKHYICMRAILWVLLAVMPKGTAFKQILSGFGKFLFNYLFRHNALSFEYLMFAFAEMCRYEIADTN